VAPSALEELFTHRDELQRQNQELERLRGQLEVSHHRFADLYDLAPIPFLTLSQSGMIEEVNETAVRFLERERGALEGMPLAVLIPSRRRPAFRRFLVRCLRDKERQTLETELALARTVPVELICRRSQGGRLYLAIVDRSARAHAKERRQLLSAADLARAESTAKDRFLATLSHELRTPLTPVLAAVSAFERRKVPREMSEFIALVARCLTYEARLVDDLLDVTRLTHGKMTYDRVVVDLHTVVLEALEMVIPEAQDKELQLETNLRARNHHVRGDPVRLKQVFANLLRNACKFTPRGGLITVESRAGGRGVVVAVSDTGAGIRHEDLALIFERFSQGRDGYQGGLGLGLAIARGIVQGHGGRIAAISGGPGEGATFEVELQCVPARARPAVARKPVVDGPLGRGEPVLLVEDHADTARVLSGLLARAGFVVTVAGSMKEALGKADGQIRLVISDIGLPDGSGLDLMRSLRARHRDLYGIAMSGYGTREDVKKSRRAGFAHHLVKPVQFEELLAAIAQGRR
jgi:signal transduction histidine kinase